MYVAPALVLQHGDRQRLELIISKAPTQLAQRAHIVLLAASGLPNTEIAQRTGTTRPTVLKWRERYGAAGIDGLTDRPRPGRRVQVDEAEILAETLADRGIPPPALRAPRWSSRLLASRLDVSYTTVARVWRKWRVQPDRLDTYVFPVEPVLGPDLGAPVALHLGTRPIAVFTTAPGAHQRLLELAHALSLPARPSDPFCPAKLLSHLPGSAGPLRVLTGRHALAALPRGMPPGTTAHHTPSTETWLTVVATALGIQAREAARGGDRTLSDPGPTLRALPAFTWLARFGRPVVH